VNVPGALVVDNVSKRFVTPAGTMAALERVSLAVAPGRFVSIIGPSGCGKSTLFGVIGGLVPDYDGKVSIDGTPVDGTHGAIGMVFQEESTFPWLTVLENIMFPLEARGVARAERRERAERLLELVGLHGFGGHYPAELSGGMKSRTAIARTLAAEPKILLMDEPFAALDEQTRLLLGDKLLAIWRELNQTTLLITHSITEAVQLSDEVMVMTCRPGRIKRVVPIDLPRPRTSEIVGSAAFGRLVGMIWNDLREEALRGLAQTETTAPSSPALLPEGEGSS